MHDASGFYMGFKDANEFLQDEEWRQDRQRDTDRER